ERRELVDADDRATPVCRRDVLLFLHARRSHGRQARGARQRRGRQGDGGHYRFHLLDQPPAIAPTMKYRAIMQPTTTAKCTFPPIILLNQNAGVFNTSKILVSILSAAIAIG